MVTLSIIIHNYVFNYRIILIFLKKESKNVFCVYMSMLINSFNLKDDEKVKEEKMESPSSKLMAVPQQS